MTVELVLLTPVLLVLLCLAVGLGRVAYGHQQVEAAAAAASRAATLTTSPGQADAEARRSAAASLAGTGITCGGLQVSVDVTQFHPGGQVAVTLACTAALRDLAVSGLPGTKVLTATARTPLEQHRVLDGATP